MSNDAKNRFDPRFDPAFQPGFDGGVVPLAKPVKKHDIPPAQAALEQRTGSAEHGAPAERVAADEEADLEVVRRPNPFLIALTGISVVLIGGGISAIQSVRALFTTENISVDLDYISLEMIKFGAPLSIALGVATGIGVLFLLARDWKHRDSR